MQHNEQIVACSLQQYRTRYGPNRPAADMEGNGEFFWVRAIRANWKEEEKKEDRLKAKERMARLRKSRTVEEQNKV